MVAMRQWRRCGGDDRSVAMEDKLFGGEAGWWSCYSDSSGMVFVVTYDFIGRGVISGCIAILL